MSSKIRLMAGMLVFLLVLSAGVVWAGPENPEGTKPAPAVSGGEPVTQAPIMDQRALDILKAMSDAIAGSKTLEFKANSMVPIKGPKGMWINLFESARVVKQGAGKLFAERRGDYFPCDFYFNGKTITRHDVAKNVYAEKDAPATIDALIEKVYQDEGKTFPYADILVANPYEALSSKLEDAVFVGQSTIQGVKTDHLAFKNKTVDWQIWIGTEDHLPRLVNATYLNDVREPSYTVQFSDWKLNELVPESTFIFTNASNAAKVEFQNPK